MVPKVRPFRIKIIIWIQISSLCHRYDEIAQTITGVPVNTDELVALNQYLKRTSEVTVHKLRDEVDEAGKRLSFLLDYATLPGT